MLAVVPAVLARANGQSGEEDRRAANAIAPPPAPCPPDRDDGWPYFHVRPVAGAESVLRVALERSSTVAALVTALEQSDVVVWLAREPRLPHGLESGVLTVMGRAAGSRRFRITIKSTNAEPDQVKWLGHELWHAWEVSRDSSVADAPGLKRLFSTIGDRTYSEGEVYETAGAVDAGHRAYEEYYRGRRCPGEPAAVTAGRTAR